jgi:hypothetical protein
MEAAFSKINQSSVENQLAIYERAQQKMNASGVEASLFRNSLFIVAETV